MSEKGTSLRQMSLTESFNKVKKMPRYKFHAPTLVSDVIYNIEDTDSEVETPLFGYDNNSLTPKVQMYVKNSELNALNADTAVTDLPFSDVSGSSSQTMIYDYLNCIMDTTVDHTSSPSSLQLSDQLMVNDPNNFADVYTQSAMDSFSSPQSSTRTSGTSSQAESAAKRKLMFEDNNESHNKKINKCNSKDTKLMTTSTPKMQSKNIQSAKILKNTAVGKENSDKKPNRADDKDKSASGSICSPNVNTSLNILQNVILTPSQKPLTNQNMSSTATVATTSESHQQKQMEPSKNLNNTLTIKNSPQLSNTTTIPRTIQSPILTSSQIQNPFAKSTVKKPFIIQRFKSSEAAATSSKTPQKPTEPIKNPSSIKQSLATPKKTQPIDQQPSTSKTPVSSPSKSPGGSPKKKIGSPSKGSPRKYRELKSLKAKEGKQLQIRQLNELVGLFREVATSIHLKDLLNSEERAILKRFEEMEDDQKYFVMKLFIWKKSWYNIFKFCSKAQLILSDNDKDVCDIFEYLREGEFVYTDYKKSQNLLELFDQLDIKDLKEIMNELRIFPRKGNKQCLIDAIFTAIRKQRTLTEITLEDRVRDEIEKKMGFAVKIRDEICQAFFHAYTLGTFTNNTFDDVQAFFRQMTEFRVVFPETKLEDYPVFYSREKFVLYAQASKVRKELDDILGNRATPDKIADICTIAVNAYNNLMGLDPEDCREHRNAPHLKRFSARHVYCSVLSTCCQHAHTRTHGKPNDVKKWLECLIKQFPKSSKLGFWYHRLIWLHMRHLNVVNYETAAKLLIDVFETKSDRLTERDKLLLAALARPLKSSKKHKIEQLYHDRIAQLAPKAITDNFPCARIDCKCIRSDAKGRKRTYIKKGNQEMTTMSVENVALEHYAESGFPGGQHCEGSLLKALLMLYFWDIIYNPERVIPGTFISKLQIAPLDIFTRYFYENREEPITRRLKEIEFQWSDQHLLDFASDNWRKHSHEQNPFGAVELTIPDIATVEVLVTVLGRKVIAKVFERLIKDLKENSSGMPDLLLWNVEEKTHKFVEVKGEGDRLAPNQILWLDYLQKAGASIEVCLVHSLGSKRKPVKLALEDGGGEEVNSDENENA